MIIHVSATDRHLSDETITDILERYDYRSRERFTMITLMTGLPLRIIGTVQTPTPLREAPLQELASRARECSDRPHGHQCLKVMTVLTDGAAQQESSVPLCHGD